jgi:cobalt-zinc-cadmium efflux system protein
MAHDHSHAHAHAHAGRPAGHGHSHHGHHHVPHGADAGNMNRVGLAALVTGVVLIVEVIGGVLSGSLALIADAGHMASDFASLVLAWIGFRIAARPPDARRTFGFSRVLVLAAFVNGLALVAVAVWILVEAAGRLLTPHAVDAPTMLGVAVVGLVANMISFFILHGADRDHLNVRGALLHVIGDLIGSVAAITAAVIIMFWGWTAADPLLSILIAVIMLRPAANLIRDSAHVLIEGSPGDLDADAIAHDLEHAIDGVLDIHHPHLWSLDGRRPLMTLHARISDPARGPAIIALIKQRLAERHGVNHATVEIETDECAGAECG